MSGSTVFCRLLLRSRGLSAAPRYSTHLFVSSPPPPRPIFASQITRHYSGDIWNLSKAARLALAERAFAEVRAQAEIERKREREEKKKAGIDVPDEDEDFLHNRKLLGKLERQNAKDKPSELNQYEEPTDSDSESEDEEAINMRAKIYERKFNHFEKLVDKFSKADSFDDAFKWMKRIDEFEEKHFKLRSEYQVIGDLMNKLKVAKGKDQFLLQVKLNRALKLVEAKDAFDPNDPANYGVIEREDVGANVDRVEDPDIDEDGETNSEGLIDRMEFDDLKQKDTKFLEKINEIDEKLEEKLAQLDYTFGKKGKLLEEEIRDLAEERNSIIEQKRQPLYRKGFAVRLVNVNRTCKVTKGGQVIKYTAILACGNYNGVVGYAKAKAPAVPIALQKAREKCFQNLHCVELHENHTVAHAVQAKYKRTEVKLWPAAMDSGLKAGRTAEIILNLAGYKNLKSKVIGSRNPHNTVKAVLKALNSIESPKDIEEKFGRVVIDVSKHNLK